MTPNNLKVTAISLFYVLCCCADIVKSEYYNALQCDNETHYCSIIRAPVGTSSDRAAFSLLSQLE